MCRFEVSVRGDRVGNALPQVRCVTHQFFMGTIPIPTGVSDCPIGQIEKATQVALLEIANAREAAVAAHSPIVIDMPPFETPNV